MHDLKQELVISAEIFLQQPKRSVSNTGKKTSEDIGTCSSILGRYGKLKHFAVSVKLFERISNAIPFPSRQTKRRVLWDKSRGEHPDLQWRLPTWVYGCCIGGKNHAMCMSLSHGRGANLWARVWYVIYIWSFELNHVLNLLSYFWTDNSGRIFTVFLW